MVNKLLYLPVPCQYLAARQATPQLNRKKSASERSLFDTSTELKAVDLSLLKINSRLCF